MARIAIGHYPGNKGVRAVPTRNVHLTEHFDSFIASGIESGRFSNASEAVRAGLHLLEREEAEGNAQLEWLRGATQEAFAALDRGEGLPISSADVSLQNE